MPAATPLHPQPPCDTADLQTQTEQRRHSLFQARGPARSSGFRKQATVKSHFKPSAPEPLTPAWPPTLLCAPVQGFGDPSRP